ncbi:hypothetical protein GCM10027321_00750 [Massilia terrae]|uniref:Uncharacterized protein n=1 Tax=Massilia terrae TaxID=1811224 RepID=A0ABT2CVD5_9BURK|nr:hypothetical protein [Massilia terrae]MCS0657561.1 hypothetical protein [Massilia terrae]
MSQLTVVLPFALPAPEFAKELARSLNTPALAALLSRTSSHTVHPYDFAVRALPHEVWLARELGLEQAGQPAFAAAAMRGFGLDPREGTWFIVSPAHIEIARSHLMMPDLRHLQLSEAESRALFDAAVPYAEESGHHLAYGDAHTWFLRADSWAGMDTATPDTAVGMNLTDYMPAGPHALAYRKLQNEIQMLWYTDAVNAARESRRQPPVNAFWLWSGATTVLNTVVPAQAGTHAESPKSGSGPFIATFETTSWLKALGTRNLASPSEVLNITGNSLLICGNAAAPAIAADWSGWLHEMQRFEADLFVPLLAALSQGRIKQLKLVLSNRTAHTETTTTALAQRKFWRRPTLERLL